jgi:HSP20 family protein
VIQGERRTETREEREGFLRSERYFGSFSRQVPLPPDVDPNQIGAVMNNGVLTLNMPKSEERRGRQIDIR